MELRSFSAISVIYYADDHCRHFVAIVVIATIASSIRNQAKLS